MLYDVKINCITTGYDYKAAEWWTSDERARVNTYIPTVNAVDEEDAVNSVVNFIFERYRKRLAINEKIERNVDSVTVFNKYDRDVEFTTYSVSVFEKGE